MEERGYVPPAEAKRNKIIGQEMSGDTRSRKREAIKATLEPKERTSTQVVEIHERTWLNDNMCAKNSDELKVKGVH